MVADGDAPKYGGAGKYLHVVADDGALHLAVVAQCHQLQTIEIATYAFGVQVGGVVVLKVGARSDAWAPDVECRVGGKHPFDEYRYILAQAVIKQVAEHLLSGAHFDKGPYATAIGRVLL